MKKFYTVLSALACGAFMSVTAGTTLPSLKASNLQESQTADYTLHTTIENLTLSTEARPARVAARAAQATTSDFVNDLYLSESYGLIESHNGWATDGLAAFEAGAGNEVTVYSFLGMDAAFKGTFSPENSTLTIPTKQVFDLQLQSGTIKATFLMLDVTTKPYKIVDDDIVLSYNKDERYFYWMGESQATAQGSSFKKVLGLCRAEFIETNVFTSAFDFIGAIEMNAVNNIMTFFDANAESQSGCYIYAAKNDEGLSVNNFLGAGFASPIQFTLDAQAMTATATKQVVVSDGTTAYYLMTAALDGDKVVGNTTVTFGARKVNFTDENDNPVSEGYVLSSGEQDIIVVAPDPITTFAFMGSAVNVQLEGMDLFGNAGINGVVVEDVENAPVEYYNLQGMKVANPEHGIYVRRQGSRIEKVLVK